MQYSTENEAPFLAIIRKQGKKYRLISKDGKKTLGIFNTHKEAIDLAFKTSIEKLEKPKKTNGNTL